MPRYKIHMPEQGEVLSCDGDHFVVAESDILAREVFNAEVAWAGPPIVFIHPVVASYGYVTKRGIEDGAFEFFDDEPEPGQTYWEIRQGDPIGKHEVRAWAVGMPYVHWAQDYAEPEKIDWQDIPAGVQCYYKPEGNGVVCAPPYKWRASGKPRFPILFDNGTRRDLFIGQFSMFFGGPLPQPRRRVKVSVAGETVVEACSEDVARLMVDLRTTRLRAEWEAEQFAALVAA